MSSGARSSDRGIFPAAVFNFDHLEPRVQSHLKNVYSCLTVGMLSAGLGAYADFWLNIGQWSFLTFVASIGLLVWLQAEKHTSKNIAKRIAIYIAFTFLMGTSLGPLLDLVVQIDPSIIPTALAGTAIIFISFTLAALLSRDRKFIYLGGFLFTSLWYLLLVNVVNLLFGSILIFDITIYLGLLIFSGFVLYDTQLIVEKRRRGDVDFVWHSVDLFIDAIAIFRRLMIILARKEEKKRRRDD